MTENLTQPFVDFVLEHNPQSSRRLTQAEAHALPQAGHKRGHVHTTWFNDACLDRYNAIRNCCECCCSGIKAMTKYDLPLIASSGYVARVAETEYARCGTCEDVCPFEAVQVDGRAVVEWERCMGCGVCEGQCAHAAISRISDARKGAPRRMDVSQQLDFHQLFKYRLEAYHHVTFPAKRRRAILTGEVRQRVHYTGSMNLSVVMHQLIE